MGLLERIFGRRRPPVPVTMYVRQDCDLCELMKRELDRAGLKGRYELRLVDIETEATEQQKSDHVQWLPVLEIGGRVAFKVRMTAPEFKKRFRRLAAEYHAERARGGRGS